MEKQNDDLTVFAVSSFDVHKFQEFSYSNGVSMKLIIWKAEEYTELCN